MDLTTAKKNLTDAAEAMESCGVGLFLLFGTLLGAVREGDFIAHDEDIDVGLFAKDEAAFLAAVPRLESLGFRLTRARGGRAYDFEREGLGLDFFVVKERREWPGRRAWDLDGRTTVAARHLDRLETIDFAGRAFLVPCHREALMRRLYGLRWRTPIADRPAYFDLGVRARHFLARKARHIRIGTGKARTR